ncbi:MAG: response regulator [Cyclobacteriaceae bacterium]
MTNSQVEILLIEDSMDDAELTIRALKKRNLANRLLHISDSEKALEYLFDPGNNHFPKIILLDLKMPKVDGIQILKQLKGDPAKKVIPVVVLTSSKEERDIIETYNLGVNAYIVKPVQFDKFMEAVDQLGMFWLLLNQPPK